MKRSGHIQLRETVDEVESSTVVLASQFSRINRVLLILLRRESRIQYEYDVSGHTIFFRIRATDENLHRFRGELMRLFRFNAVGFNGFRQINCCTICAADGVTQFEVRTPVPRATDGKDIILVMWEQSAALLSRLPKRSSAASAPISRITPAH